MTEPSPKVPPQNLDAERELLGAALTLEGIVTAVQAEVGLRVEDFYLDRHKALWAAMLSLANKGTPVSELTIAEHVTSEDLAELGGREYLGQLSIVSNPSASLHHAKIVRDRARWRRRLTAGQEIQAAAYEGDDEAFTKAHALLTDDPSHERAMHNAQRQRDALFELIEGQGKADFYWPLDKLNRLQSGGLRRGQLVVLSGYTNEGKSHFAGQILDVNCKRGRVCLYDNEMQPVEQAARRAVRLTHGVTYGNLLDGKLEGDESKEMMKHLNRDDGCHWPIVDTAGWTVQEVALHIRQHRFDLVVIDILHNFPFSEEREIAKSVADLKAAARLANCVIVLVAHVNRGGVGQDGIRRRPVRSDLRWSGEIENLADAVCFVFREQDLETKEPTEDGFIYFDKVRGGKLGVEKVRFVSDRLRFQREDDQLGHAPPDDLSVSGIGEGGPNF